MVWLQIETVEKMQRFSSCQTTTIRRLSGEPIRVRRISREPILVRRTKC